MRQLVTIRNIDAVINHPNADRLDLVTIGGWQCVAKRDEFKTGDKCMYHEVDCWLPTENELYKFLDDKKERQFEGVTGVRLRTIKLRGAVSQGLVVPVPAEFENYDTNTDVTEQMGVLKWDKPIPQCLQGRARGNFPSWIRKTDQNRAQNLTHLLFSAWRDLVWEVTLKLDGSSMTGYYTNNPLHQKDDAEPVPHLSSVCSRNLDLKIDDNEGNAFVRMFIDSGLNDALVGLGRNIAVQGELMGEKIQGNREGFDTPQYYVFDVFDIDKQCYLGFKERDAVLYTLDKLGARFREAPVREFGTLSQLGIGCMADLLEYADTASINNPIAEGYVFKSVCGLYSFKIINNKFLLEKDN